MSAIENKPALVRIPKYPLLMLSTRLWRKEFQAGAKRQTIIIARRWRTVCPYFYYTCEERLLNPNQSELPDIVFTGEGICGFAWMVPAQVPRRQTG